MVLQGQLGHLGKPVPVYIGLLHSYVCHVQNKASFLQCTLLDVCYSAVPCSYLPPGLLIF